MAHVLVASVALLAAVLTFFSGFGLGTLLLPVFALFFPIEVAVAATALVHLANNLFRLGLVGRHAQWAVVFRFGLPAALAAFLGARLLFSLSDLDPVTTYTLAGQVHTVTWVKLVVAALIGGFALFEVVPALRRLGFSRRYLVVGGALSGFFGGLSGHQGALRSAFLIKVGLNKEAFIGTSAAAAVIVDVVRLAVYGAVFMTTRFAALNVADGLGLVGTAVAAAFVGSLLGARLLPKVTLRTVRLLVGTLLLLVATGIGTALV